MYIKFSITKRKGIRDPEKYRLNLSSSSYVRKIQESMNLFKDIGRNSKPPPNFPDETIEGEVCKCHESAFYDVRSKVDQFQVPHGKRKTLWTRPLLMGAEEIGHFVTGWYFHQFEGYRHVMTVVRKAGEAEPRISKHIS